MVLRQTLQIQEIVDPASDPGSGLALALDRPETVKICSKTFSSKIFTSKIFSSKIFSSKKYISLKKKIVFRKSHIEAAE